MCLWVGGCQAGEPEAGETQAQETESNATESSGTETGETETETETETGETETETGEPEGNLLLSDKLLNIAHRGGGNLRPEATLPAFENALAVGADAIEFDLHLSADGVIVVIHDATVDRTTEGSGAVEELSFAELRALDAGYQFSPDEGVTFPYRGMGIQIPTLAEVLETFPDTYYFIEIKAPELALVPAVLDELAAHEVEERVMLVSFNQVIIDEIRALAPEQFTAMSIPEMLTFNAELDNPDYVPPSAFIQPSWDFVNQAMVDRGHELGLKIHPWTANTEGLMLDLISYGVDGIMSDDPALLNAVLGG